MLNFTDLDNWSALPKKIKIICQEVDSSNKGCLKKSSLFGLSAGSDSASGLYGL